MTQSSRRGRRASAPATTTATRGVIVVVVAAFIGFILLLKGGGGSAEGTPVADLPTVTATPTTVTPTTATPSTAVPPAQLKVGVANGTQTKHLAAQTAAALKAKGYTTAIALDATQQATTSQVYFVAGSEGDAKGVAAALGLPSARVAPMPAQPPVPSLGSNKVIVLLGPDAPGATPVTTTTIAATTTTA